MIRIRNIAGSVLVLIWGCAPALDVVQQPVASDGRDLGAEVLRVFKANCSACHGPGLERPEGRFGYVLDLQKIRQNPELVIPGHPDESELWILVHRHEMPPRDSGNEPLGDDELSVIKEWIAAGAPDAVRETTITNRDRYSQ